jgi:hypothetical protein
MAHCDHQEALEHHLGHVGAPKPRPAQGTEALLRPQEDIVIRAKFPLGFDYFPKHLRTHTCRLETLALRMKPEERSAWLTVIKAGRVVAEATSRRARHQEELERGQCAVMLDWLFGLTD